MNTILLWICALIALRAGAVSAQHWRLSGSSQVPDEPEGSLRLATWNVHYIWLRQQDGRWGLSGWEERKGPMDVVFKALEADLVAFQEMESFARGNTEDVNLTREWLLENNPDYAAAATGPWREFPPTQPIFYRRSRLEPLDRGWFFFSTTPDVMYSRGFNGAPPSFASWVDFKDLQSGAVFRFVNIHVDAGSRGNRRRGAELAAERIKAWRADGKTVLFGGDLNARHGAYVHRTIAGAGLTLPKVPGATFHLDRGLHLFGAIDHLGYSGTASLAQGPFVVRQKVDGIWASDHHPVLLDVNLGTE